MNRSTQRLAQALALPCLLCAGLARAQNVITNSGFESGTNGWTMRSGGTLLNGAPGHSGTNAARVANRTSSLHGIQQSLLGVLPTGTFYFGSAWVRTSSPTNVSVKLSIRQTDRRGDRYLTLASGQVSNVWEKLSGTFPYDVNGLLTNLLLYVSDSPSGVDLYVDDVSLAPLDPMAIENLLVNPGFESGIDGWMANGSDNILPGAASHTGTNCVMATNRTAAYTGVQQSLMGKVQIGRTYFVSAWVATDRPTNDVVKLTFQRKETAATNYVNVATGIASSAGWTWLSGYYTPQTTGTVTALNFYVEGPASGVTLFVDDAYVGVATGLRKAAANYSNVRLSAGGVTQGEVKTGAPLFGAFLTAFHHFSPGNALKLQGTQPDSNLWTFAEANMLLDFSQAHGGSSRGHAFVWHSGGGLAPWVTNVVRTPNELRDILWNRIDTAATYYHDRLPCWDVVNEAMADSGGGLRSSVWYDSPGIGYAGSGPQYIAEAFKRARTNAADAALIYNDYSIETVNTKSTAVYNMLSGFVLTGVPVNGLGMQAHLSGTNFDAPSFRSNLQRFQDLGLDLQITELDVRIPVDTNTGYATAANLEGQGEVYFGVLGTALGLSNLKLFQTWGIYDGISWIPAFSPGYGQALPFDFHLDKKPAYWAMWNALAGQAEKLAVLTNSSGDTATVVSNAILSASNGRRLNANAANDFITLQAEVPFKGQWSIKIGVLTTNHAGRFQLAVAPLGSTNFVNVGSSNDTYAASMAAKEFNLGTNHFSPAGDWQFRFTVPSKNSSSSGYDLTLDYLRLTPVACEPLFTQPLADQSIAVNRALAPALFLAEDAIATGSLAVTATSANPSLVPDTNILLIGGSPYYTVAATPLTNRAGSAVISLVADNGTLRVTNAFTLTVGTPVEAWRTAYFGSSANSGSGADTANPDSDFGNNLMEYIAGTSPTNTDAPSRLDITNVSGNIRVSFTANAATGPGYTGLTRWFDLLRSTNLASGRWPGVSGYTNLAGNNEVIIYTNVPSTNPAFYKLQIRLP